MKSNNTKDIFLHTASVLFANKGYHATGISEILKQSRAPKGSLYYYFPQGKEQLAVEALHKTAQNIYDEINSSMNGTDNPVEGLQKHLRLIAQKVQLDMKKKSNDKTDLSISLIALETFSSNEKIRQLCQEIFAQRQKIYEQKFLACGMKADVASFFAMNAVILTEGALTLSLTQKSAEPLFSLAENLPLLFKEN